MVNSSINVELSDGTNLRAPLYELVLQLEVGNKALFRRKNKIVTIVKVWDANNVDIKDKKGSITTKFPVSELVVCIGAKALWFKLPMRPGTTTMSKATICKINPPKGKTKQTYDIKLLHGHVVKEVSSLQLTRAEFAPQAMFYPELHLGRDKLLVTGSAVAITDVKYTPERGYIFTLRFPEHYHTLCVTGTQLALTAATRVLGHSPLSSMLSSTRDDLLRMVRTRFWNPKTFATPASTAAAKPSVLLVAMLPSGLCSGSATYVDRGTAVMLGARLCGGTTWLHMLSDHSDLLEVHKAEILETSEPDLDLMLLRLPGDAIAAGATIAISGTLRITYKPVKKGDRVWVMGFAPTKGKKTMGHLIHSGTVLSVDPKTGDIALDMKAYRGLRGALLQNGEGYVVGMLTTKIKGTRGVCYAINLTTIPGKKKMIRTRGRVWLDEALPKHAKGLSPSALATDDTRTDPAVRWVEKRSDDVAEYSKYDRDLEPSEMDSDMDSSSSEEEVEKSNEEQSVSPVSTFFSRRQMPPRPPPPPAAPPSEEYSDTETEVTSEIIESRGCKFVGRTWLAEAVSQAFTTASEVVPARHPSWIIIYGDVGTGKTAFMRQLINKDFCDDAGAPWQPLHARILAQHECSVHDPKSLEPKRWTMSLAESLIKAIQEQPHGSRTVEVEDILFGHADAEALLKWAGRATVDGVIAEWMIPALEKIGGPIGGVRDTILVDSLDEALNPSDVHGDTKPSIVSVLRKYTRTLSWRRRKLLPSWIRIIATSRPDETTRKKIKPLVVNIDVDSELNCRDIQTYVKEEVSKIDTPIPRKNTRKICAQAKGTFRYAVEQTKRLQANPDMKVDEDTLPPWIAMLYTKHFKRTFPKNKSKECNAHAKLMMAALLAAREPLPFLMVENLDRPVKCPTKWWFDRESHLEFVQRFCAGKCMQTKDRKLQLAHHTLHEWLTSAQNKYFGVTIKRGHVVLGDLCEAILTRCAKKDELPQITAPSDEKLANDVSIRYAVKHWPRHLCDQGRVRDAVKLMCSFQYILARVLCDKGTGLFVQDGSAVMEQKLHGKSGKKLTASLKLVVSAARMATDAVREETGQIVGQIVGHLMQHADSKGEKLELIVALVKDARSCSRFRWWCPVSCSLAMAGGQPHRIFTGHSYNVRCVTWSPDGLHMCSGALDNTLRVWDVDSGTCKSVLRGHSSSVLCVEWSPGNDYICSGSGDNTVRVWKVWTGACVRVLKGHNTSVLSITWSPDGQRICSSAWESTICIWDTYKGVCERIIRTSAFKVCSVSWCPDGRRICTGEGDKTIRVYNASTGACERFIRIDAICVNSVAWSPDGLRVCSGATDKTVRVWDMSKRSCESIFEGHTADINSVVWSPDGLRICSGSTDKTVRVWEVSTGKCEHEFKGHVGTVSSVAWSPSSLQICSTGSGHSVHLWDLSVRVSALGLDRHSGPILSVNWSPDGGQICTAAEDSMMRLWTVSTGLCVGLMTGHRGAIHSVVWSPDGQQICSGAQDRTVRLWKAEPGSCERVLEGHTDGVQAVAWSPDSNRVCSGATDHTIRIWNASTGECEAVLKGHSDAVVCVAWSPDGKHICSGALDMTLRIWDVSSGACEHELTGHPAKICSVSWSPDTHRICSGTIENTLHVWNVTTEVCEVVLKNVHCFEHEFKWNLGRESHSLYYQRDDGTGTTIRMWHTDQGDRKTKVVPRQLLNPEEVHSFIRTAESVVGFRDAAKSLRGKNRFLRRGDKMVCWNETRFHILSLMSASDDVVESGISMTTPVTDVPIGEIGVRY